MNTSAISTWVAYNFWANERVLAACERVTTAEFTCAVTPDPGKGSLRGILVHALDAEYGWRSVLQAQSADEILAPEDFAEVAALKARWARERGDWVAYVARLTDASLNAHYGGEAQKGMNVWQTILHVVNHGTQHRSEAAAILTGYGQSPGELDFDLFLQENAEPPMKSVD